MREVRGAWPDDFTPILAFPRQGGRKRDNHKGCPYNSTVIPAPGGKDGVGAGAGLGRPLVLPEGALRGVFKDYPLLGQVVADLVGQGVLAGLAQLGTGANQQVDKGFGG